MATPQLATSVQVGDTITIPGDESGRPPLKLVADRVIGSGSFGVVYLARIVDTDEFVAVKKVLQDRRYKNRELAIMKSLKHVNCVALRSYCYSPGNRTGELYLNLVMDYYPETMYSVVKEYARMRQSMPLGLVRLFSYQLARSLLHLHLKGIAHRDLKPQNLLVDPLSGRLTLCDFGSAKVLVQDEPNVAYICSRYYRAPELVFGSTYYTLMIDVWSLGAVLAEMLLSAPLFPGESSVDQLLEIVKVLGTPTKDQIRAMHPGYRGEVRFTPVRPQGWPKVFRARTDPLAVDLTSRILTYDPAARLSVLDIMAHPFFDKLRAEDATLPNGRPLPSVTDWSVDELRAMTPTQMERLCPAHARGEAFDMVRAEKG